MVELAITGGQVLLSDQGTPQPMTLLIERGKVAALLAPTQPFSARQVLDVQGMLVIPGVIDIHVHCRDPSFAERGDFESETRAAAAGGVCTIFEMPISEPCAATPEILRNRRAIAARKAHVNVGFYGAPGLRKADDIARMAAEGVIGFKLFTTRAAPGRESEFRGLTTHSLAEVVEALELIRPTGLRCVFHAEEQSLLELYTARARASKVPEYAKQELSRPDIVEAAAVAQLLTVAKKLNTPIHIAHVTAAATVSLLRQAKDDGVPVSAETCPHYLFFTEAVLKRVGPFGKINPPIRYEHDREALWQGLDEGVIDLVATDHAPFTVAEKDAYWDDIIEAPPGHPGLEVLTPLVMAQALAGRWSIAKVVSLLSSTPARLFGLYPSKGALLPGSDADITIIDPKGLQSWRTGAGVSRATACDRLYDGMEVPGKVYATVVAGKVVYCQGEFSGAPGDGQLVWGAATAEVGLANP